MRYAGTDGQNVGSDKSVGPPWGMDQKDAALAAMIALQGRMR